MVQHAKWSEEDRQRFADGDRLRAGRVPVKRWDGPTVDEWDDLIDWGDDDVVDPYSGACDLENPESCESCQ